MRSKSEAPAVSFSRPFGRPRSARVREHIAQLDAQRDCHTIVSLLSTYEFPFDIQRSLEVALFHTYGSRSVARLLDKTGEFRERGQKRYDDTRLLIARFMEEGFGGDGRRALGRMNDIHSFYKIPNDDFLFVLWTFMDFPIEWMKDYGYRAFTEHECTAWFHFWVQVGQQMGIRDIPATKPAFDEFVRKYEAREFVPSDEAQRVAQATLDVLSGWFPKAMQGLVEKSVLSLVRPQLRTAIRMQEPAAWVGATVRGALRVRSWAKRYVSLEKYPSNLANSKNRTYPGNRYTIEAIGPEHTKRPRKQSEWSVS